MKKRIITLFIIFLTITSSFSFVSAQNETIERSISKTSYEDNEVNESKRIGENVKANEDGYLNISFEDGYNGYCINKGWEGATKDHAFTVKNTSSAVNNNNGEEIGNYIKILFVDFHDEVSKNDKLAQNVIWSFSNDYFNHKYTSYVQKVIDIANTGRVIADHGTTININNTTKATFDFEVLSSNLYGFQNFFGYKITYSKIVPEKPLLGGAENNFEETPEYESTNNTTEETQERELTNSFVINTENNTNENETQNEIMTENNNYTVENETNSAYVNDTNEMENRTNPDNNKLTLNNHTTGYSLIFAIIAILLLGCIIIIKIKRD